MTLIVCMKAKGCIVIAADSLTTHPSRGVISLTTKKIHTLGTNAATAGCGLARVNQKDWESIFRSYRQHPAGTSFSQVTADLKLFLDKQIQKVDPKNVGACIGGNTFLLAGYDQCTKGFVISEITRIGDRRLFESPTIISCTLAPSYLSWHGDTTNIAPYLASRNTVYSAAMNRDQAIDFSINSIKGAIAIHSGRKIGTIGGTHISVCVISSKRIDSFTI